MGLHTLLLLLFYFFFKYQGQPNWKHICRRSSNGDEEEDKEVGWKYIHGDVFRHPPNMPLFCAVLGVGTQLLTM